LVPLLVQSGVGSLIAHPSFPKAQAAVFPLEAKSSLNKVNHRQRKVCLRIRPARLLSSRPRQLEFRIQRAARKSRFIPLRSPARVHSLQRYLILHNLSRLRAKRQRLMTY
jgi:hypothetical protein